jgi:hypothetical protein
MQMRREDTMSRKIRILLLVVSALLALVPAVVLAQDTNDDGDFLLRINGPVTIGPEETHEVVVVISDDLMVEGVVDSAAVVVDGNMTVTGRVDGYITVVSGTLTLLPTAQVDDVEIIDGTLVRQEGAVITGDLSERDDFLNVWQLAVASVFFWLGMTLVVLAAGVIFAAVAGRQLKAAGTQIAQQPGPTFLAALLAWIATPVLMVLAIFTLVGIPMGVGYIVFVLPILWFVGYIVAGTQLGRLMLRRRADDEHPYLPALLGLIVLQAVGWLPWFGGLIAFVAGVIGSGALLLLAWRAWRGPAVEPVAPVAPARVPVT